MAELVHVYYIIIIDYGLLMTDDSCRAIGFNLGTWVLAGLPA